MVQPLLYIREDEYLDHEHMSHSRKHVFRVVRHESRREAAANRGARCGSSKQAARTVRRRGARCAAACATVPPEQQRRNVSVGIRQ